MLPRHQAQPGGEVSRALEHADVGDCRRDQGRSDRTDAGDRRQAARGVVVPGVGHDLRLECLGAFIQRAALIKQSVQHLPGFLRRLARKFTWVGRLAKLRLRVPPRSERWAGPVIGAVTGVVTGATGVFVIPAVPYLGSLGLERDDLIQALGLSFTVSTLALAAGLAWHGALPLQAAATSLLALVPALAGMALGGWMRVRVRPETFRLCFFVGLLALGGELAWRGLA